MILLIYVKIIIAQTAVLSALKIYQLFPYSLIIHYKQHFLEEEKKILVKGFIM